MKKILIVGEGSFIGGSIQRWLLQNPIDYKVTTITSKFNLWKEVDFTRYDVVINVAGIAHIKIKPKMEPLFYKVNRDLAVNLAKKAKAEGVRQYIYLSSMNVYGDINEEIDVSTNPSPENFYGNSKLQADLLLQELNETEFKVISIRPPVVYGRGCKGNYKLLEKIARWSVVFPDYKNIKSMIYIDNLCEFIKLIIDNEECGVYHPQNKDYISTTELVKLISKEFGKRIYLVKWLNPLVSLLSKKLRIVNRAFGDDYYAKVISDYQDYSYCLFNNKESIKAMYSNEENRQGF
ncbi:MAG: hypothetical protein K0S61_521 [Anaerocolumna sp.]|jgi:UDP-glucose 4-epimerase|nr:hypothetical protein [Anaerocolumna sp.]